MTNFSIQNSEKEILKEIAMPINTFHGKQDHTFTKIYKFSTMADSEWCEAVNAMVVNNVKDTNVPLKLLLKFRKIWLQKNSF